ncbi:hypothetical protein LCGC14_0938380 [marine sediment metagenome]|uniref:Uncharacterized protein n=1 Tax=marine sediment metagenome TaxID=412755 RepID=A0A0F9R4E1_9ZZZZ
MSVAEVSKETGIIIRGLVKGPPIYAVVSPVDYIRHRLVFPIVLTEDIEVGFKKAKGEILKKNSTIVVKCSKLCYVSVGDAIKISGKIVRVNSEIWDKIYLYIKAKDIFNETIQTGIVMF